MSKIRIALVEDHRVVREGLRILLEQQPDMEVVAEAGDAPTALRVIGETQPAIVVMDVSLPRTNGARLTEELLQAQPGLLVLALSVNEEPSYLREMLDAGARGYALKRAGGAELVRAIRTVAEGGLYVAPAFPPESVRRLLQRGGTAGGDPETLSPREEEILVLTTWGHANKEIAARLGVSVKTVETHKARAMDKLGLGSRAQLVRYAVQRGWMGQD